MAMSVSRVCWYNMLIQEGTQVAKGELLAVLDTQRLALEVTHADAQLAAQQAVVDRLLAGSRPEEIGKAENELIAYQYPRCRAGAGFGQ